MKKLPNFKKSQFGFTLIELLIVIAIIVTVIGISAVSYTTVQRNARDSQRKADLAKIQAALEEFYTDHGAYPDEDPNKDFITCTIDGYATGNSNPPGVPNWGQPFICDGKTYMTKIPADPLYIAANATDPNKWYLKTYAYEVYEAAPSPNPDNDPPGWCKGIATDVANPSCQQYTLWATLENPTDPGIAQTLADPICQMSITKPKSAFVAHSFMFVSPNGTANYCVHGPR